MQDLFIYNRRIMPLVFIVIVCLGLVSCAQRLSSLATTTKAAVETISEEDLKRHLTYIASDELEGRATGSAGIKLAEEYITKEFVSYGLLPMGDKIDGTDRRSFAHQAEMPGDARLLETGNSMSLTAEGVEKSFIVGESYLPFSITPNGSFKNLEVVFAGYGISDTENAYDDYADIDVKGKAVVILRYDNLESQEGKYSGGHHAYLMTKINNGIKHGAAVVILINGPNSRKRSKDDNLYGLVSVGAIKDNKVPYIHAKREFLISLLDGSKGSISNLQLSLDSSRKPHSFVISNKRLTLNVKMEKPRLRSNNIVAMLEGSDPVLKNEYVVIGAHYDHLGYGSFTSIAGEKTTAMIHNGADDNGSGTVGVVEIAQAFSLLEQRPKRSIIFMLFCGEERGLHGSKYFVDHPTVPVENIVAMLNLDMVGRLKPDALISVNGAGTSSIFKPLIARNAEAIGIKVNTSDSGKAPSDNTSFFRASIPVLYYSAGGHPQYHKPEDDVELINFKGEKWVCEHTFLTALEIANLQLRPDFVRATPLFAFGFIPDNIDAPVRMEKILPYSIFAGLGLQKGDQIIKFGKVKVGSVDGFAGLLKKQKKGSQTVFTVKRIVKDGTEREVEFTLKFKK